MEGSPQSGKPEAFGWPPPRIQDYELIRFLGRGHCGEAWIARHVTGVWRAIKVVRRSRVTSQAVFELAWQRLRDYAPLSRTHESLVTLLHTGQQGQGSHTFLYGVMELADAVASGTAWKDAGSNPAPDTQDRAWARQNTPFGEPFDPKRYQPASLRHRFERISAGLLDTLSLSECVSLGLSLVSALEVLHEHGLVHGGIRPSNILYVKGKPKLAELGLVPPQGRMGRLQSMNLDEYHPPEGPGTVPSDLYSLGKVLKEARDRRRLEPEIGPEPMQDAPAPSDGAEIGWQRIMRQTCHAAERMRSLNASNLRRDLEQLRDALGCGRI